MARRLKFIYYWTPGYLSLGGLSLFINIENHSVYGEEVELYLLYYYFIEVYLFINTRRFMARRLRTSAPPALSPPMCLPRCACTSLTWVNLRLWGQCAPACALSGWRRITSTLPGEADNEYLIVLNIWHLGSIIF